jgi:hypothetical protein
MMPARDDGRQCARPHDTFVGSSDAPPFARIPNIYSFLLSDRSHARLPLSSGARRRKDGRMCANGCKTFLIPAQPAPAFTGRRRASDHMPGALSFGRPIP